MSRLGEEFFTAQQRYRSWANYKTWHVAHWLQGNDAVHAKVVVLAASGHDFASFAAALQRLYSIAQTPEGVRLDDPALDRAELDQIFKAERDC